MKQRSIECVYSGLRGFILLLLALFSVINVHAQNKDMAAHPKNLKIIDEHKDKSGNLVRVVRYEEGNMLVTQTIIIPKHSFMGTHVPINPDTMKKDMVRVVVDKSHYCLMVFYRGQMIRVYKAVFGPNPLMNKCMEGDRCTPEGWFKIANKNPASKYHKFMGLNYPNDSSIARFNHLKEEGLIPKTARMGGSVGIHGIWPGGDDMIDMGVGWTDGCIAIKNKDIDDLYSLVGVGTNVLVKR